MFSPKLHHILFQKIRLSNFNVRGCVSQQAILKPEDLINNESEIPIKDQTLSFLVCISKPEKTASITMFLVTSFMFCKIFEIDFVFSSIFQSVSRQIYSLSFLDHVPHHSQKASYGAFPVFKVYNFVYKK